MYVIFSNSGRQHKVNVSRTWQHSRML